MLFVMYHISHGKVAPFPAFDKLELPAELVAINFAYTPDPEVSE